jgi:hypothetical protein
MSAINFQTLTPKQKADYTDRVWWEEMGKNPDNEVIQDPHWFQIVTRSTPSLMANGVMRCEIKDGAIDDRIRKTIEIYRTNKLPFHWTISPSSRPEDLAKRLVAAGMSLGSVSVGFVGDPNKINIPEPPHVTVEPLSAKTLDDYAALLAHSHLVEQHALKRLQTQVNDQLKTKQHWVSHFLARYNDVPAGICQNRYHQGYIYQLGGSVKPEFRNKGVYSALLRRLNIDAVEKRIGIIVCHAPKKMNHSTSTAASGKSIEGKLLQFGYEKTCDYETYQWRQN